jgi:hypothetical protein
MPSQRNLNPVRVAHEGEQYDVVACPWDGAPAVVFPDKRGQPYARCMVCGCRFFGNTMAFEVGKREGRVRLVTWPATDYDAPAPIGGSGYGG